MIESEVKISSAVNKPRAPAESAVTYCGYGRSLRNNRCSDPRRTRENIPSLIADLQVSERQNFLGSGDTGFRCFLPVCRGRADTTGAERSMERYIETIQQRKKAMTIIIVEWTSRRRSSSRCSRKLICPVESSSSGSSTGNPCFAASAITTSLVCRCSLRVILSSRQVLRVSVRRSCAEPLPDRRLELPERKCHVFGRPAAVERSPVREAGFFFKIYFALPRST